MTSESKTKVAMIRKILKENNASGMYISRRDNFAWLTCGKQNHVSNGTEFGFSGLLVTLSRVYLITDNIEMPRMLNEELIEFECEKIQFDWFENDRDKIIRKIIGTGDLFSDTHISNSIDCNKKIQPLKYSLCSDEIERYRETCVLSALAVEDSCREIEIGMSEYQIAAKISHKCIANGINAEVTLVATDERIFQYKHPIPTDKKLSKYAMLVVCGRKYGLVASVTRLVHIGAIPYDLEARYGDLLGIEAQFLLNTKPDNKVSEIFTHGISAYKIFGYKDDWKEHHQGGATGYAGREYIATNGCYEKVKENQAFAWNPTLRGVKVEDTILATKNGIEVLSHTGKWAYEHVKASNDDVYIRPKILSI